MNVFTHIVMSKWLYQYLKDEMNLNKRAFIYGNIKPDLVTKCFHTPHTLENYLMTVCNKAADLIDKKASIEEYSVKLGEICHYTCDFFCLYHTNLIKSQNLINHFLYEMKLHNELLRNGSQMIMEPIQEKSEKNVASIIMELIEEYSLKPAAMKKDIMFGLSASLRICKSVFSHTINATNLVLDNNVNYATLTFKGGH